MAISLTAIESVLSSPAVPRRENIVEGVAAAAEGIGMEASPAVPLVLKAISCSSLASLPLDLGKTSRTTSAKLATSSLPTFSVTALEWWSSIVENMLLELLGIWTTASLDHTR